MRKLYAVHGKFCVGDTEWHYIDHMLYYSYQEEVRYNEELCFNEYEWESLVSRIKKDPEVYRPFGIRYDRVFGKEYIAFDAYSELWDEYRVSKRNFEEIEYRIEYIELEEKTLEWVFKNLAVKDALAYIKDRYDEM